ncbi:MAG: LCP family protein [Lactobacillus sp.]|nr:LCP family protein [Lactobacillus sp.]
MDQHPHTRRAYRKEGHLTRNQSLFVNMASGRNVLKRFVGIFASLAAIVGIGYFAHIYFSINSALAGMGGQATSYRIANRQPISVLILGVDQGIEGRHDVGNSDTLILATANPAKNKATMTSIPRDTLADIQGDNGKYFMFKINSAYQVGGNKAASRTVSSLLNVPVHYYVEVNMKALKSLVNAVGGVNVKVPFSFSYDWNDFHKGWQHLNGRHAVAYVRMRHDDPRGDYGRQMRQRQVIQAIAKKATNINTLKNYRKLVTIFNKYVKTNLSFGDMMALAMNYRGVAKNIKSNYIQAHDAWIDGYSIQVASTKELQKKSNMIRKNLGLNPVTLNNEETRQNKLNEEKNNIDWTNLNAFENYQVFDSQGNVTSLN